MTSNLTLSAGKTEATFMPKEGKSMSNGQVRLVAAAFVMLVGVLAAGTDSLSVNVGIAIILVSGAMFLAEYVRSQR